MENKEIEVTLRDVLGAVAGFIITVSALVALFALIWGAWHTFRVSTTVFVAVCLLVVFVWFIEDKFKRK